MQVKPCVISAETELLLLYFLGSNLKSGLVSCLLLDHPLQEFQRKLASADRYLKYMPENFHTVAQESMLPDVEQFCGWTSKRCYVLPVTDVAQKVDPETAEAIGGIFRKTWLLAKKSFD